MPTIYGEPTDNQLDDFISNRKSFKIVDLQETGYWAEKIEKKIEEYGLTVRNYTVLGLYLDLQVLVQFRLQYTI